MNPSICTFYLLKNNLQSKYFKLLLYLAYKRFLSQIEKIFHYIKVNYLDSLKDVIAIHGQVPGLEVNFSAH